MSIADLNDGTVYGAKESLTDSGIANSSAKVVPPGTILLAMYGSIGKLAIAGEPLCTSQAIAFIRPDPRKVDRDFLFHYLRAQRPHLQAKGRGGTQMNISQGDLKKWPVPLPPLDEQRRIAAILDQADELVTARNMTIGLIGNLRQSIFIDMFGAPDRLSKNWVCAPLSDLAHTCSGGTPSRADNSYYGGDIPWVKSGEVAQGLVVSTEEAITEAAVANSSARVMPPGTVLVAMYGATAGKVGILGISAATNQAVCSITPGDRLEVGYLVEVLRSMNDHLLAQRSGGAQPNLSQGVLRGLQIPVPPIEIQEQFCRRLAEVDALDSHVVAALASHSVLFQSLQARAFAGQL